MEYSVNYLRNRIREYSREALFDRCISKLQNTGQRRTFPVWSVLILLRWAYQFAGSKLIIKELTDLKFNTLLSGITSLNDNHLMKFMKEDKLFKPFLILYYQQFYLQRTVFKDDFTSQINLYTSTSGKYDIAQVFKQKTGLSILDFLKMTSFIWIHLKFDDASKNNFFYKNKIKPTLHNWLSNLTSPQAVEAFFKLITVNLSTINQWDLSSRNEIKNLEFQPLGISAFTRNPLINYKGNLYLSHLGIFNYFADYFIYDYLRDDKFTTEFGSRLEKYIEFSLKRTNIDYKTEKELKKLLPKGSNVVDFYLEKDNIFIECKASDLQPYSSINPTDSQLVNSLKTSLIKAYFKQLQSVASALLPQQESWGIIITFKELFWSDYKDLYETGIAQNIENQEYKYLPPENVFIIDFYSWNRILLFRQLTGSSILSILKKVKESNNQLSTKKLLFSMHLESFDWPDSQNDNLSFLEEELDKLTSYV